MISYQCNCNSKYKNCDECPLNSREVFTDFARRLSHFCAWREINITFKRLDNEDIVFVKKDVETHEQD